MQELGTGRTWQARVEFAVTFLRARALTEMPVDGDTQHESRGRILRDLRQRERLFTGRIR